MKKLMFKCLLSVLVMLSMDFFAVADTELVDGITWTYTISDGNVTIGDGGNAAIDTSTSGILVVPERLGGSPVTAIGSYAFKGCNRLTSVVIPSSVTSIGNGAFANCEGLADEKGFVIVRGVLYGYFNSATSVIIPVGVTGISRYAFENHSGLVSVKIPSTVTFIEKAAFTGCSGLTSLVVPASVERIGEAAFRGCSGLTSLTLPFVGAQRGNTKSVKALFGYVFGTTSYLGSTPAKQRYADFANSVHYIPASLKSVVITDETTIGYGAFSDCQGLTSVTIPASVTSVGNWAFRDCVGLMTMIMPEKVASVGEGTFWGCKGLRSVTMNRGVVDVGDNAFPFTGLSSVTIPNSVKRIGDGAFYFCGLASILIPPSVTSIGYQAFEYCSRLTVYVSSGDKERVAGLYPFEESVEFVELKHPHTVKFDVGEHGSWTGGGELVQVIEHGEAATVPIVQPNYGWKFAGWSCDFGMVTNDLDVSARWDREVLNAKIGNETWAFYVEGDGVVIGNDGKTAVEGNSNGCLVIPQWLDGYVVVGIEEGAFAGLDGLRSVVIPETVVSIGKDAFAGCIGLDVVKVAFGDAARMRQLVSDSEFDVSWVEFREKGAGAGLSGASDVICLAVTNVTVNYVLNSVQPQFAFPASSDVGFVNIIAEVKGGSVAIPATWMANYPNFVGKFGSDFTKALAMKTGKKDGAGNDMFVWQDYVAGTDPTKEDDVFTASIMIVDGKVKVSYSPELDDARKALRKYTTWGKVKLTDKDWSVVGEGEEDNFSFFKVTVEMR